LPRAETSSTTALFFVSELLFGLWRTYTSLDTGITEFGRTSHLTMPRRIIFTHTDVEHWRDYSGMNALIVGLPVLFFSLLAALITLLALVADWSYLCTRCR
jgi:hypothetical protein